MNFFIKNKKKIFFVTAIIVAVIYFLDADGIIVFCPFYKSNIEVTTIREQFSSVDRDIKSIQKIDGEIYLLLSFSPAHIPESTVPGREIYCVAKCGGTVFVTINNVSPELKFKITEGLYEFKYTSGTTSHKALYAKVKCKSIEEAKAIAGVLGVRGEA